MKGESPHPDTSTATPLAVVMGDLVASERAVEPAALHQYFNAAIARQNKGSAAQIVSPLTITLGDEFQGLAHTLVAALAIVRNIRADLMHHDIDCRFAIGLVALTTPLNTAQAWNMMGPGLSTTRERLNQKRQDNLYRFALPNKPIISLLLEALGTSLTAIERRWTAQQRLDILAALSGQSASAIAQRRNVSRHSVYKVRNAGDFDLYTSHWAAIETTLAAIDAENGLA